MGRFGVRVWAVVAAAATTLGVLSAVAVPPAGALAAPTVSMSAMTSPFPCDQRVQATVTGTTPSTPPTGTVQFLDGVTPVGAALNLPNTAGLTKTVTSSLLGLAPGAHSISMSYSGDANYSPASTAPQAVTFAPYKSAVSIAALPPTAPAGVAVSFPVTVTVDSHCFRRPPGTTHPSGRVVYRMGTKVIGSGTLVNGFTSFTSGVLGLGTKTITASYAGDGTNFLGAAPASTQVHLTAPGGRVWHAESLATSSQGSSSLIFANAPHVFFYDPATHRLMHRWWTGRSWALESLDGAVGGLNGRTSDDVGASPTAILSKGLPNVFYYDATVGDLRHASWDGHAWHFESLDGFTGPRGRTNGDVGLESTAVVLADGLHVFYRQVVDATHSRLRHAWLTSTGWSFAQLDPGANTGRFNTAIVYGGQPHVFSYTGSNLRHAWLAGGTWHYENLDGTQAGPHGQVNNNVGAYAQAVMWNGRPNIFYQQVGASGKLRHAWFTGSFWAFQTLDGAGNTSAGAVGADVGYDITVTLFNNSVQLWYRNATDRSLRRSFWSRGAWHFDVTDGYLGAYGQRPNQGVATVGTASVVIYRGSPHVFYTDAITHRLRHSWWG